MIGYLCLVTVLLVVLCGVVVDGCCMLIAANASFFSQVVNICEPIWVPFGARWRHLWKKGTQVNPKSLDSGSATTIKLFCGFDGGLLYCI